MTDLVVAIIAVIGGLIWLFGAAMLIGAFISVVRPDHRHPIAYRWIRWHAHHSKTVRDETV
jgi:hypothetical protein